ncbi:signal peptidase II [Candidatus Gracilibacteria bacterium]|nr:signal peptidase II [Candidatus Gracilibacteria bacterium]
MSRNIIKNIFIKNYKLYFIILLIFFDFVTKLFFSNYFIEKKVNIFGDYLFLELYKNTGIAFSIDLPYLKIITIFVICLIIWYYTKYEKKKNNKIIDLSFILIISGAIGNARERLVFGEVTDFIGIKYFSVFNLADIYINIGIIIYLIIIILKKDKHWL